MDNNWIKKYGNFVHDQEIKNSGLEKSYTNVKVKLQLFLPCLGLGNQFANTKVKK